MKKTTSVTTFNNWTKQLSKLKRSKANFTIHNVAKGIKKSNNCARANIGILLVNLPITDINEFAILVADIFADPIIGTPLVASGSLYMCLYYNVDYQLKSSQTKVPQYTTYFFTTYQSDYHPSSNPQRFQFHIHKIS